jgi:hypothetical protein
MWTPDEIRPDKEGAVQEKIPFLRVGSWVGWVWYCM